MAVVQKRAMHPVLQTSKTTAPAGNGRGGRGEPPPPAASSTVHQPMSLGHRSSETGPVRRASSPQTSSPLTPRRLRAATPKNTQGRLSPRTTPQRLPGKPAVVGIGEKPRRPARELHSCSELLPFEDAGLTQDADVVVVVKAPAPRPTTASPSRRGHEHKDANVAAVTRNVRGAATSRTSSCATLGSSQSVSTRASTTESSSPALGAAYVLTMCATPPRPAVGAAWVDSPSDAACEGVGEPNNHSRYTSPIPTSVAGRASTCAAPSAGDEVKTSELEELRRALREKERENCALQTRVADLESQVVAVTPPSMPAAGIATPAGYRSALGSRAIASAVTQIAPSSLQAQAESGDDDFATAADLETLVRKSEALVKRMVLSDDNEEERQWVALMNAHQDCKDRLKQIEDLVARRVEQLQQAPQRQLEEAVARRAEQVQHASTQEEVQQALQSPQHGLPGGGSMSARSCGDSAAELKFCRALRGVCVGAQRVGAAPLRRWTLAASDCQGDARSNARNVRGDTQSSCDTASRSDARFVRTRGNLTPTAGGGCAADSLQSLLGVPREWCVDT